MWSSDFSNIAALVGILLVSPTATSAAAAVAAPKPNSHGICYKYVVQAGQTCSTIAKAHSITTADIEAYNARSWAWSGCGHLSQGDFICLSAGEPMMPVALPNAVCGPQVPGATRPDNWSELGSMNPCPAGQCCSSWGLCGSTPDFCNSAPHAPAVVSKPTVAHPTHLPPAPKKTTIPAGTTKPAGITKPIQQPVISSKTRLASAAKPDPPRTSVLTITKTTSATSAHKTTTSTTKSTKSIKSTKTTKTKAKTSTSKPLAATPWSLTMYTKKDCKGDYYLLQGYNKGYSNRCLNLHGGLSSKMTETGVSCKWFMNGGSSNTNCDAGTLESPESWSMKVGICTVFNAKNCNHTDGHANAYLAPLKSSCRNRGKFDPPKFLSMNCYTETD